MNMDAGSIRFDAMQGWWDMYSYALMTEMRQCRDEGKDVEAYEPVALAIDRLPRNAAREELADTLYRILRDAPLRADYPYHEPSDLEGILAARPEGRYVFRRPEITPQLRRQVRGAWLGRIAGCLLGKPIEGMRTPDITELLKNSGNYPLKRYMTKEDVAKTPRLVPQWGNRTWIDNLDGCAPVDDDTNYTSMAAKVIIDKYGRDFTPDDVARAWLESQNIYAYCTAERRAYMNFVTGLRAPESAEYKNAYREYIGAQIRADYFGYINPGDPETAARMAWRDASISHVKNGIYGEMFIAAVIAAAAVCDDVPTVIEAGLEQIPARCRLSRAVLGVLAGWKTGVTEEECFASIAKEWDEFTDYDWCHTISNAEIVTAALLYGGMDYSYSICRAVMTGFDTDCNGATVGSILGIMLGDGAIGEEWTAPINGTLDTSIFGVGRVSIEEMVDLTMKHMRRD